jgi:hypothetical protein
MTTLAIVLLVLWIAAHLSTRSHVFSATVPAGAWNLGLLLLTILTSFSSCAAPIVKLIDGFRSLAEVAPEHKAEVLSRRIDDTRPAMLLPMVTLPVLIFGIGAFIANRRAIRQRRREQAVSPKQDEKAW